MAIAAVFLIIIGAFAYVYFTDTGIIGQQDQSLALNKQQIASLNATMTQNKAQIAQDTAHIAVLTNLLKNAQANYSTLQKSLILAQTQIAAYQSRIQQLLTAGGKANATIATLRGQVNTLNATIIGLKAQLTSSSAQITDLNNQITLLQNQIGQLNTQISQLNSQITALKTRNAGLNATVTSLQSQTSSLQSQVSSLKSSVKSLSGIAVAVNQSVSEQISVVLTSTAHSAYSYSFPTFSTTYYGYIVISFSNLSPARNNMTVTITNAFTTSVAGQTTFTTSAFFATAPSNIIVPVGAGTVTISVSIPASQATAVQSVTISIIYKY
jgi:predicted  nucleic acid-binding Zn-ribbon protein